MPDEKHLTEEVDPLEAREHLQDQADHGLPVPLVPADEPAVGPVTPTAWRLLGLVLFAGFLLLLLFL